MSRQPEVLWAQRSDKIYLTVSLPDAKDISVNTEPQGVFSFSATGPQEETFGFTLELYAAVVPEGIKTKFGLRNILYILQKEKQEWWHRLLKSEGKPAPYIKADWNRWCDEDEEQNLDSDVASDDDLNGVNDRGSNDHSSDDDSGLLYIPDLEKARRS